MDLLYAMTVAGTIPVIGYYIIGMVMKGKMNERWQMIFLKLSMFFFLCPFQVIKYKFPNTFPAFFHSSEPGKRYYLSLPGHMAVPESSDGYTLVPVWEVVLGVLWFVTTTAFVVFQIIKYYDLKKAIKKTSQKIMEEPEKEERDRKKKRKKIKYLKNSCLKTPFAMGILNHWIVLPEIELDESERAMILEHEQKHIEKRDILMKFICMGIILIHWFNPAAWLLLYEYGVVSEYVCDQYVTAMLQTEEEKRKYAALIVKLSVREKKIPVVFADHLSGGEKRMKQMKNRIDRILDSNKRKVRALPLVLVLVLLLSSSTIIAYEKTWAAPKEDMLNAKEGSFIWFDEEPLAFLDFKESSLYFVEDGTGEGMNLKEINENEVTAECEHSYTTGTIYEHVPNGSGGCTIYEYNAKKCTMCSDYIKINKTNTLTYEHCIH